MSKYGSAAVARGRGLTFEGTTSPVDPGDKGKVAEAMDVCFPDKVGVVRQAASVYIMASYGAGLVWFGLDWIGFVWCPVRFACRFACCVVPCRVILHAVRARRETSFCIVFLAHIGACDERSDPAREGIRHLYVTRRQFQRKTRRGWFGGGGG